MARASNLTICSFCGKSHAEVKKLIAGPGVYICDNCISVCKTILDKETSHGTRLAIRRSWCPSPRTSWPRSTSTSSARSTPRRSSSVAVHNHYKRILSLQASAERKTTAAQ